MNKSVVYNLSRDLIGASEVILSAVDHNLSWMIAKYYIVYVPYLVKQCRPPKTPIDNIITGKIICHILPLGKRRTAHKENCIFRRMMKAIFLFESLYVVPKWRLFLCVDYKSQE